LRESSGVIIAIIIVAVVAIGAFGIYTFITNSDLTHPEQAITLQQNNSTVNSTANGSTANSTASNPSNTTATTATSMNIQQVQITTGSSLSSKSHADVYVGKEYAGESVTISTLYSRDGNTLNDGNDVSKTVDSDGYVHVTAGVASKYYPDTCVVTISGPSGSDSVTCYLNIKSGTQTCNF